MKPLRSKGDHEKALVTLEEMLSDPANKSSRDEIEVLSILIEDYERKNFPVSLPGPIEAIKFRMTQAGLEPRDLEPYVGSRARVSEVLAGKRKLSLQMIRALHAGLGIPLESLCSQNNGDGQEFETPSPKVLSFMRSIGFDVDSDNYTSFIRRAFSGGSALALHRRTRNERTGQKLDRSSLVAWQAVVLQLSKSYNIHPDGRWSTDGVGLLRRLAKFSKLERGPSLAQEYLRGRGIALVFVPTFPGTRLDGAAMFDSAGKPVVCLTLRHDRVDNFWFTLLHEIAHVIRHSDLLRQGECFFDDLDVLVEDEREAEADRLAQEALIPPEVLKKVNWGRYSSHKDIETVAQLGGVHISIPAGRWQRDHGDYRKFSRLIVRNTIRSELLEHDRSKDE